MARNAAALGWIRLLKLEAPRSCCLRGCPRCIWTCHDGTRHPASPLFVHTLCVTKFTISQPVNRARALPAVLDHSSCSTRIESLFVQIRTEIRSTVTGLQACRSVHHFDDFRSIARPVSHLHRPEGNDTWLRDLIRPRPSEVGEQVCNVATGQLLTDPNLHRYIRP
jgi:hypothetical protein